MTAPTSMPRRVVVTGGAGFIGSATCEELRAAGVREVVALDDLSSGRRRNLDGVDAELVVGSILDVDALDATVAGADAIIHLAARPSVPRSIVDPASAHEVNTTGTFQVLEAARRHEVGHVIVASSSSVYGANPELPKREDMTLMPVSPYAATKLATETYATAWAAAYGLDVLAFRFFNVFGPRQPAGHAYAAVVPAFVAAALREEPLPVNGDGTQSRDFTAVVDVAGVLTDAVRRRVHHPGPVNLAFGTRTSLLELVDRLAAVLGRPLPVDHRPPRPGDVAHSQADRTRFRSLFPQVTPTELSEMLARTVEWFRSEPDAF